jgi:hypothetical protein
MLKYFSKGLPGRKSFTSPPRSAKTHSSPYVVVVK